MSNDDSADRLLLYFRKAVEQRRLLELWSRDRTFKKDGGRILYSVDTDIIMLYVDPARMSVPSPGGPKEGYAMVFGTEKPDLAIPLGFALAKHIFFTMRADSSMPLLVTPPLEREVGRVFASIAAKADTEQKAARKEITRITNLLKQSDLEKAKQDFLFQLQNRAPNLYGALFDPKGKTRLLGRFNNLFSTAAIAAPEYFCSNVDALDPAFKAILGPPSDWADIFRLLQLKNGWLNYLHKAKGHSRGRKRRDEVMINDDAEALARIECMNELLEGHNCRIIHITGAHATLEAARCYIPDFPEGNKQSFADLYIRHPRTFLGDDRILFPVKGKSRDGDDETKSREFPRMLALFLSKLRLDNQSNIEELNKVTARKDADLKKDFLPILKANPNIVDDLETQWSKYLEDIRNFYMAEMLLKQAELKEGGNLEAVIQDSLDLEIMSSWSSFFAAITETGFGILFQGELQTGQIPARSAPPLYFEELSETWTFVKIIMSSLGRGKLERKQYEEAIKNLRKEDKKSGYFYSLAFGVLFATEGRWPLTLILADKALERAEALETSPLRDEHPELNYVSGREAYYLKAVALRHVAKTVDDLTSIRPLLEKARCCLERDKATRNDLEVWPLRFEIEYPALNLTKHLFNRLSKAKRQKETEIGEGTTPTLAEIQADLIRMLEEELPSVQDFWIHCNIERKLLTNLLMTALLRVHHDEEDLDLKSLKLYLERFELNLYHLDNIDPEMVVSYLVRAIFLVMSWWLGPPNKRNDRRNEVKLHFAPERIERSAVMPYDKRRFKFMRDIVLNGDE